MRKNKIQNKIKQKLKIIMMNDNVTNNKAKKKIKITNKNRKASKRYKINLKTILLKNTYFLC